MMGEIAEVETDAAVVFDVDQLSKLLDVLRLAVGRQPHDLPLRVVYAKAQVGGDGAEQQPHRLPGVVEK